VATIPYADVLDHETLPIDAQEVVTRARLVVAGNRAGWEPGQAFARIATGAATEPLTPFPVPIVHTVDHADHATYEAIRSFGLPEGIDPFLPPTDDGVGEPYSTTGLTNAGSPSAIRDDDPATYATSDLSGTSQVVWRQWLTSPNQRIHGFRLVYTFGKDGAGSTYALDSAPGLVILIQRSNRSASDPVEARYYWPIQPTEDHDSPMDVYAVAPFDARGHADNNVGETIIDYSYLDLTVLQQSGGGELRIHAFYPLILNEALLDEIGAAQLRVPAASPKRVTVTGTIDPLATSHTITGWPGGDYTGQVARQTYREGVTVIDFEQAGAPLGAPQEVVEAERVRVARTRASIETAGYGLKMGERQ